MTHMERSDAVGRKSDSHPCDSEFCHAVMCGQFVSNLAGVDSLCMKTICPAIVKRFEQLWAVDTALYNNLSLLTLLASDV